MQQLCYKCIRHHKLNFTLCGGTLTDIPRSRPTSRPTKCTQSELALPGPSGRATRQLCDTCHHKTFYFSCGLVNVSNILFGWERLPLGMASNIFLWSCWGHLEKLTFLTSLCILFLFCLCKYFYAFYVCNGVKRKWKYRKKYFCVWGEWKSKQIQWFTYRVV